MSSNNSDLYRQVQAKEKLKLATKGNYKRKEVRHQTIINPADFEKLSNARIIQKQLVYVIGLPASLAFKDVSKFFLKSKILV
jgi:hypothetical protein